MTNRAKLRTSIRVTIKGIEFEVFRLSLNDRIDAVAAAKPYEGTTSHNEVLMRETIARMVYLDGEPLGDDAGKMDLEIAMGLAPLITETQVAPMVPAEPERPIGANGANGTEEPAPKAAS